MPWADTFTQRIGERRREFQLSIKQIRDRDWLPLNRAYKRACCTIFFVLFTWFQGKLLKFRLRVECCVLEGTIKVTITYTIQGQLWKPLHHFRVHSAFSVLREVRQHIGSRLRPGDWTLLGVSSSPATFRQV